MELDCVMIQSGRTLDLNSTLDPRFGSILRGNEA
jgi:hypothetical protein